MNNIIIATIHKWNIQAAKKLEKDLTDYAVHIITEPTEFTSALLASLQPEYVFFPHWSWIIPEDVYTAFPCIVFHMTDLPYGRGGSPLQNLIAQGVMETRISAIEVVKELDAGRVYLKEPLSLYGGAEEIYMRASSIIFKQMIPRILKEKPAPMPQQGEVTRFKRRTPEMSEIAYSQSIQQMFDHIRMLDAPEYPHAFINYGGYRMEFTRPKRTCDGIVADVLIKERKSENNGWH